MIYLSKLSIFIYYMFIIVPSCSETTSPTNIFILGGQSNMAGRGGVEKDPKSSNNFVWDGIIPQESQPNPSILSLNLFHQWEEAHELLHRDIDFNRTVGIGPGIPFANQLLTKAGRRAGVIGLVPCARGGTLIESWMKNSSYGGTFYNELISRIKVSHQHQQGGTVRALFWFQGESDASNHATAVIYKEKIKTFFTDIRNDVKPIFLPIIVVKIASYDTYIRCVNPNMTMVRNAEDTVHEILPDVQIIDAKQLVKPNGEGFNKDHVHLNTNSQISLGKWLADTYLFYYGNLL